MNRYDGVFLDTSHLARGEKPRRSLLVKVGANQLTNSKTFFLLVILHYPLDNAVS